MCVQIETVSKRGTENKETRSESSPVAVPSERHLELTCPGQCEHVCLFTWMHRVLIFLVLIWFLFLDHVLMGRPRTRHLDPPAVSPLQCHLLANSTRNDPVSRERHFLGVWGVRTPTREFGEHNSIHILGKLTGFGGLLRNLGFVLQRTQSPNHTGTLSLLFMCRQENREAVILAFSCPHPYSHRTSRVTFCL